MLSCRTAGLSPEQAIWKAHISLIPNLSRKTLTKKVRRSLVFLDKHMSSPGRDIKHLKVAFGMCRVSGGSREGKRKEQPWSGAQGMPSSACRRGHPAAMDEQGQEAWSQSVCNGWDRPSLGSSLPGREGTPVTDGFATFHLGSV